MTLFLLPIRIMFFEDPDVCEFDRDFVENMMHWCCLRIKSDIVDEGMSSVEDSEIADTTYSRKDDVLYMFLKILNGSNLALRIHLPVYCPDRGRVCLKPELTVDRIEELIKQYERQEIEHGADFWLDDCIDD